MTTRTSAQRLVNAEAMHLIRTHTVKYEHMLKQRLCTSVMHTHTHSHTHTHTRTHTQTNIHTHTRGEKESTLCAANKTVLQICLHTFIHVHSDAITHTHTAYKH